MNTASIADALLQRAGKDIQRQRDLREYLAGIHEEPRRLPMRHVEHERSDDWAPHA